MTDRLREVAPLLCRPLPGDHVTCETAAKASREDVAEPQRIAQLPGRADCLGAVRRGRVGIELRSNPQAASARASRAGLSPRARAPRPPRPDPDIRAHPIMVTSRTLSASASARTAGAISGCCALSSARIASNHATPSASRGCQSGVKDDANINANSMSHFRGSTRMRRASCRFQFQSFRCAARSRCLTARRATPPSTCSDRGDVPARCRPPLTRRVFRPRTAAPFPIAGTGFGPGLVGHQQRLVHE